jgi:hypothetical protein
MRKTLLLSAVAALFFFSCKKEHSGTTKPSGKKYQVTFNVSNFTQGQTAFSLRHNTSNQASSSDTLTTLNGYLDLLYYIVYDQFGHGYRLPTVQDSTNAHMGMITDSLPAGSYTVVLVAGKKGLLINDYGFTATASFGYGGAWQDAFWNTFPLTVVNGSQTKTVTLNRVIGKLELQILDNIPATADSLTFSINPESFKRNNSDGFNDGEPFDSVKFTVAIPAGAKGQPNFTVDRIIGNTATAFTVSIACKDASNHILGSAVATNVVCHSNTKTVLAGDLFGHTGGNSQSFTVKVDTAWNSGNLESSFSLRRH